MEIASKNPDQNILEVTAKHLALTAYINCQQRLRAEHSGSNSKTLLYLHPIEIASRNSTQNILGTIAKENGTYALHKFPAETQIRTSSEQYQETLALTPYIIFSRLRLEYPGRNSKICQHLQTIKIASRNCDQNILGALAK